MLCNRYVCFYLLVPALFTISGCWPSSDKQKAKPVERVEIEEREIESREVEEKKEAPKKVSHAKGVVIEVESDEDFKNALKQGKPVIADFWAEWCGPCKQMKPIFHKAAEKHGNDVVFVSVNEKHRDKHNVFKKHAIEGFPTFILFDASGKQIDKHIGGYDEEHFDSVIADLKAGRP